MNAPLDQWMTRKGRAVLDEKKKGFFVYDDGKGWIVIAEIYFNKTKKALFPRTHDMTSQAIAKAVKSKKTTRRISYELSSGLSAGLISAINEITGLESTDGGQVQEVVESAEDAKLVEFLKKQSGI